MEYIRLCLNKRCKLFGEQVERRHPTDPPRCICGFELYVRPKNHLDVSMLIADVKRVIFACYDEDRAKQIISEIEDRMRGRCHNCRRVYTDLKQDVICNDCTRRAERKIRRAQRRAQQEPVEKKPRFKLSE